MAPGYPYWTNNSSYLIKGTHTVYFSSSFYIMIQKNEVPRKHFHCITTWVAGSSGWNLAMHLLILWFHSNYPDGALIQYKYLNGVFWLQDQTVPYRSWQERKIYFYTKKFLSTSGILNNINEQDTSFLDCKHKHMMKSGAPLTKSRLL